MIKGQRRERVIRAVILALVLPIFTSVIGFSNTTAYAAGSCTGPKIIGVQYSMRHLTTPEANLQWKRGTNTVLNEFLPTMLEWKRGTRTAVSISAMAEAAELHFKTANPSITSPTIVTFDDGFDTQTAVTKAKEWVANPCFLALIGPTQSFIANAIIPIYAAAGVPILSPSASDPRLTVGGATTFHRLVLPEDMQDMRSIQTLRSLGITKPAIFEDDEQEESLLSRWARNPISPFYSLLEWKRGTPTVTSRSAIIADAKARGVNGYFFNGVSNYPENWNYDSPGDAWPIIGEFTEVCPQCSGLVFGEQTNAAYLDGKYFENTGVEGAKILATSVPLWMTTIPDNIRPENWSEYYPDSPFSTPTYDALRFALEAVKAGNTTAQTVNTFINTKKYNGVSGPISFDSNGELAGRSQIVMTVTNGKRVVTSGLPANYVANGAISNYTAITPTTTSVALQIKDFNETFTTSYLDVNTGSLVKRYLVGISGQINLALPNGTSFISLVPDDENEIGIRRVQYQVSISNGAVTSFTNFANSTAVTLASSRYQIRLASPSAIGTVNSNFSYAGKSYQFNIEKTKSNNSSAFSYLNGKIRSDNKIYITAVTKYTANGYIYANETEDWSKRGYSKETFTATQLVGSVFNFTINPPAAKVTGQVSGAYGSGSYAQIQPLVNNSYYKGFDRSPISSDGHFGFQKPDDRFETFTVMVYAYGDNGIRATGISTQFTYKSSDTKTVSNLSISLPANNLTGHVTVNGIGVPKARFQVSVSGGIAKTIFNSTTDSNGQFSLGLAPDTYTLTFNGGYQMPYGTTIAKCVVTTGTNTCNIALTPPTVTGRVTGIPELAGGNIEFWPLNAYGLSGKPSWTYFNANGDFYGFSEPGTYLMKVSAKSKSAAYSVTAGKCTIPSSGTGTCNVSFASGLSFKVLKNDGSNFSGALGITLKDLDTATNLMGNKTTIKYDPVVGFSYPLVPGRYSITLDPHSNSVAVGAISEFTFEFANGSISSVLALESQTTLSPSNGVFSLRLARPQFEATLLTNTGGAVSQPARVWLRTPEGSSRTVGTTTASGNFVYTGPTRLGDGTYTIWTTPFAVWKNISGVESKQETFTIRNGFAERSIQIRENAPNVTGVVSGPNGPLASLRISVTSIEMKKLGYYYPIGATTDANGRYSIYLPQGDNHFYISGNYQLGVVQHSQICTLVESSTICNITMHAPNVIGKITVGGKSYSYSNVGFKKADSIKEEVSAIDYWGEASQFAAYAPPGKYRPSGIIYYRDAGGSTARSHVIGNECIVPETGTVTCATDFTKANIEFSVYNFRGTAPITTGNSIQLELITDAQNQMKNPVFYGGLSKNSDRNYISFLSDGAYRLTLTPYGKDANIGNTERYLFDVTNGAIANMRVDGTTQIVQPINGAYQLKLKSPAISGRVLATDGTTPVAYTEVRAELDGQEFFDQTDSNGYFSFDLGNQTKDGTYLVSARAPYNATTQGESAKVSVVVVNGIGNAVTLTLRTPNLVGVVSGPNGISRGNWVNIYRVYPNGRTEYSRWNQQNTDNQGRFGFRVDPGEYLIYTNDDMAGAGGTAVRDYKCTVPETGTATCNINLIAPNVRGTFTKAGTNINGSIDMQRRNSDGSYSYIGKYTYSYNNGWYMTLQPGTYRARGYSWSDEFSFYSADFVVVDSSTVNVPIVVPPVNLKIQIVSANGAVQSSPTGESYSKIYISRINVDGREHIGSGTNLGKSAGIINLRLSDGKYYVELNPSNTQLGTPKSYRVNIETGSVTSIQDASGTETVSANSLGNYGLSLGQPTISGTIVASNGTTPVPGASVAYFDSDRVCPWCERQWTSTGNNGYFGFGEVPDGQYQVYASPNSGDITKGKSELTSVTINGGQPQSGLVIPLHDANVSGSIQGLSGRFDYAYIEVRKTDDYGNKYTPIGTYYLYPNPQGNYGTYLEPGTYRFVARIYSNGWSSNTSAFSQNCVVPSSGSITCDVTINASNVSMKVVAPGTQTILQNSGIYIYSAQYDPSLATTNPQVSLSNSGVFTSYLENATWRVVVQAPYNSTEYSDTSYLMTVADGVVTRVENEAGETLTAVNGIYLLSPKPTNLRGAITYNGVAYTGQSYLRVQADMNGWWQEVGSRWTYGGTFGFNVAPGTYRIVAEPYGYSGDQAPVITTIYECVVPSSGVATCNIALSAGNLSGRIVDENGQIYRQAYINLYQIKEDGKSGKWDYVPVAVNNGIFKANLANGKFQITVVPYWDVRGNYTEHNYEILVANNVITQVRDLRTNETLTASNGTYDFVLGMPAIRGRVMAPGTSTQGIQDIEIRVGTDLTMRNWQYGTRSATNGNFALTVPDGTYVVQAVPNGSKTRYGKSETQTVVVTNGAIATPLTLRLREPNFFGRVVTPGANPVPVSGVNVNIYIDGEYFYTYTSGDGVFAAYVDKVNPNCPNNCSLQLGYYQSTEYSSKNYAINSLGDIGDKALGGVSTRVQVRAPAVGSATTANRYGYVAIEQWNVAHSQYEWMPGYHTNQLGIAGLALDVGEKYRLTAYPGEGNYALFSPKVFEVESFSAIDSPTITIVFDRPNISLQVRNLAGVRNMWGWYQVSKYNSGNAQYEYFRNGYLDEQGKGALLLPQGDYSIHFWPGKISAGVEKEILISVDSASVVTGTSVSNGVATVVLPNGNVSGYVRNQGGTGLNAVVITAVRDNDNTKMVSTVSSANGYYELNLDRSFTWTIKAIEPISASNGLYALATDSPNNAATSSADITITITS